MSERKVWRIVGLGRRVGAPCQDVSPVPVVATTRQHEVAAVEWALA